jgi:hypothetical protein
MENGELSMVNARRQKTFINNSQLTIFHSPFAFRRRFDFTQEPLARGIALLFPIATPVSETKKASSFPARRARFRSRRADRA